MSGNPHHAQRKRGRALAQELEAFIRRELPDREEAGQAMLGAYELFERETRALRGESPFPPEAGDLPPFDSPN